MSAREKIAYIKGLLDAGKPEDKLALSLCNAVVEALDALASENDELKKQLEEQRSAADDLYSICGELDADLSDVESRLGVDEELDEDEAALEDDYTEVACPSCGLHFYCQTSMLSPDDHCVECPDCGKEVSVDLGAEDHDAD